MTTDNSSSAPTNDDRPSTLRVWILASRPHTLTAALSPVIVGYNLCRVFFHHDDNNYNCNLLSSLTLQWVCFCVFIQLGTNLHNDYADFVKGADDETRVGQARATQRGWLTPQQTCRGCDVCLIVAMALGFNMVQSYTTTTTLDRPLLLFIILSSIFNAVAYTGGPYPLGYIGLSHISIGYSGLGDVFVFLYFGLVATLTVPYLYVCSTSTTTTISLSDRLSTLQPAFYVALPVGWLATAIIVVNNLRDRHTDVRAGKRTLAVRLGATFCRVQYALLFLASYGGVFFWWCWGHGQNDSVTTDLSSSQQWYRLLPLLSFPMAISQLRAVSLGEKDGAALNPHVGGTARVQLVYCLLLSFSLRLTS